MGLRFLLCLIILVIQQAIAVFLFTKRVNFLCSSASEDCVNLREVTLDEVVDKQRYAERLFLKVQPVNRKVVGN